MITCMQRVLFAEHWACALLRRAWKRGAADPEAVDADVDAAAEAADDPDPEEEAVMDAAVDAAAADPEPEAAAAPPPVAPPSPPVASTGVVSGADVVVSGTTHVSGPAVVVDAILGMQGMPYKLTHASLRLHLHSLERSASHFAISSLLALIAVSLATPVLVSTESRC
jgi:hypothetical protein